MDGAITGKLYDIQGFSVQDGPGIRTTVFLKGCPLRCPWCHSPESQQFHSQLIWMHLKCIGIESCGRCIPACPKDAISPGKMSYSAKTEQDIQLVHVDRKLCDDCFACVKACNQKALDVCGEDWTVEDLVTRLERDKPFFETSEGGVTISGGECLSQPEFTTALAKALKERGIHVAIDTTGFCAAERIEQILPYTDLFLYDLKHMDSTAHKQMVGVPNEPILANARLIAESGGKLQVRMPVIPMLNESDENVEATAAFCKELGDAVTLVQLLPYHNLGVMKYQRLDDEAQIVEAVPPTEKKIQHIKELFEAHGLPVSVH